MKNGPYKTDRMGYGPVFSNPKFGGNSPGKGSMGLRSRAPTPGKMQRVGGGRGPANMPGQGLRTTSSNMKK